MKIKAIIFLVTIFLCLSVNGVLAETHNEVAEGITISDTTVEEIVEKAVEEGIKIGVIGEWNKSLDKAHNAIYTEYHEQSGRENIAYRSTTLSEYASVIISKDHMPLVTKEFIKDLLNKGSIVYFEREAISPQELADLLDYEIFIEDEFIEEESTATEELVYVTRDELGNLSFGVNLLDKESGYKYLLDSIIYDSYTESPKKSDTSFSTMSASNIALGAHWYRTYGPLNYRSSSGNGILNERKEGYALDTRFDQDSTNDYAAIHSRLELVPQGSTSYAYTAKFFSDGNRAPTQSGRRVHEYGPHPQPSGSTRTINLGLRPRGLELNVTYQTPLNDLTIRGNSDTGKNWVEIICDYRNSAYARGTTVQNPFVVYRTWQGQSVNQITIQNTKTALFVAGVTRTTTELAHNTPIPLKRQ
ncbi:hypothetical protein [Alkalihalophilus marmarensis]|uniref:hypothetical protein n=1 Tax=Alkalihalophilus marmarensis TaxID=521377 RepID=UPI002DBE1257|nr:hypothetical protein [Alkalihalophilus marmarensis]MEC2074353.1 hypothetical protein [Alkalihalophilus marmarensis]